MANTTAIALGQTVAVDPASATPLDAYRRRRREVSRSIGSSALLMRPLGRALQPGEIVRTSPEDPPSAGPFSQLERAPVWEPFNLLIVQMEILQRQFQRLGRVVEGLSGRGSATTPVAPLAAPMQLPPRSLDGALPSAANSAANGGLFETLKPLIDMGTSLVIVGGTVAAAMGAKRLPSIWGSVKARAGTLTAAGTGVASAAPAPTGDYPLSADAMPAPVSGPPPPPETWSQLRNAGRKALPSAGLGATLNTVHTATTATMLKQKGEGYGGGTGDLSAVAKRQKNSSMAAQQNAVIGPALNAGNGIDRGADRPAGKLTATGVASAAPAPTEDYPLGADAIPAPVLGRPSPRGTWSKLLDAGKDALPTAVLGSALNATHTAITATTPEQKGEGYGGALGSLVGTVGGSALGKVFLKRFGGEEAGALAFGFLGEKVGAWAGRSAMAPAQENPQASAQPEAAADPAPDHGKAISDSVKTSLLVGAAAVLIRKRKRSGTSESQDEPESLGADAGPSPTGSPPPASLRSRLWSMTKKLGKWPAIEAGVKAVHTFATATTAEQKGAGYGGAIGGAGGALIGGVLGSVIPGVGTAIGMTVGGFLGDKVGSAVGEVIAKYVSRPSAEAEVPGSPARSTQSRRPRRATAAVLSQTTPLITPPLMVPVAKPFTSRINQQAGAQIGRELLSSHGKGQSPKATVLPLRLPTVGAPKPPSSALFVAPASTSVPPAPLALPEASAPVPVIPAPVQSPPPAQQVSLTATIPITVQGAIDAPNQLAVALEAAVRRVMADLQARAGHAQMADAPQPF